MLSHAIRFILWLVALAFTVNFVMGKKTSVCDASLHFYSIFLNWVTWQMFPMISKTNTRGEKILFWKSWLTNFTLDELNFVADSLKSAFDSRAVTRVKVNLRSDDLTWLKCPWPDWKALNIQPQLMSRWQNRFPVGRRLRYEKPTAVSRKWVSRNTVTNKLEHF